jgi:intraflagellar transport protein 172
VSERQVEAAVNHYIEAGKASKALDAAIQSKQWKRAVAIVDSIDTATTAKPYLIQLAQHFETTGAHEQAEKLFIRAGEPQRAVEMFTKVSKWDKAHALASSYMAKDQVTALYMDHAHNLESSGTFPNFFCDEKASLRRRRNCT